MSRANKDLTELRCYLEAIKAEVAFIQRVAPVTALRVQQGLDHTGLSRLFQPALDELADVSQSVDVISTQATSALQKLKEM